MELVTWPKELKEMCATVAASFMGHLQMLCCPKRLSTMGFWATELEFGRCPATLPAFMNPQWSLHCWEFCRRAETVNDPIIDLNTKRTNVSGLSLAHPHLWVCWLFTDTFRFSLSLSHLVSDFLKTHFQKIHFNSYISIRTIYAWDQWVWNSGCNSHTTRGQTSKRVAGTLDSMHVFSGSVFSIIWK